MPNGEGFCYIEPIETNQEIEMNMNREEKNLSRVVGCPVSYYARYDNGFSFCVEGELNAYKAAYAYRHSDSVTVSESTTKGTWLVAVRNTKR